jgi:hypothetical protein
MESRSRGVLDRPVSRTMTVQWISETPENPKAVIPGQPAGLSPESITTIASMDLRLASAAHPGMTTGEI